METDWNKLIELYLSGDLSVEGNEAFEKELLYNTDLQDELFTHRSIQQAAQRAHQRDLVMKASSNYYFYKKLNYFIIATVILISALSLTYFLRSNSEAKTESNVELLVEKEQEKHSKQTNNQDNSSQKNVRGNQTIESTQTANEIETSNLKFDDKTTSTQFNKKFFYGHSEENIVPVGTFISIIDNEKKVKTDVVTIEELIDIERDTLKVVSPQLNVISTNYKVTFSDTLIPVFEGFNGVESVSYTTTNDISTKSILKKSTRSLMVNSVIYVPEGSFLIVSEKKNDPVLVRNKFDNTDQIQEIGGMTYPKEKLVRKKDLEGNYYYCLPTGEYLFNQLLVVKEKSIDTLKSDDIISGVIEYQLITPTTEIKEVSKPFESAIGTKFSKSLKGKRRKQKVTDEKIKK
ncbi:MAG: hypothetical protein ACK46Y_15335 [Fluviicola sp.]